MAREERLIDVSFHRAADRRAMVVGACAAFGLCLIPGVLEAAREGERRVVTDGQPPVNDEADNYAWGKEPGVLDYFLGIPRAVKVFWSYVLRRFMR